MFIEYMSSPMAISIEFESRYVMNSSSLDVGVEGLEATGDMPVIIAPYESYAVSI